MLQVKITDDLKTQLKENARNRGLSITALIIVILEDYFKRLK